MPERATSFDPAVAGLLVPSLDRGPRDSVGTPVAITSVTVVGVVEGGPVYVLRVNRQHVPHRERKVIVLRVRHVFLSAQTSRDAMEPPTSTFAGQA
jgi:hypothetical protein